MNRLKNHRCYLAGPIDAAPDLGKTWRIEAEKQLKKRYELKVFDPLTKPIQGHKETEDYIKIRHKEKELCNYDYLADTMSEIANQDLRAITRCDFGLFYMTRDIPHYGTMEEFVKMNDSNKPCLIVFEQGKGKVYDWLFGRIQHSYFFNSFEEVYTYLDRVSFDEKFEDETNRWIFWEQDEEDKLKDEILSLAQNLLCEWAEFDGELILDDPYFGVDGIRIPDEMVESYTEFSCIRHSILQKLVVLQEKTHA